jgi:peroxiredoxin
MQNFITGFTIAEYGLQVSQHAPAFILKTLEGDEVVKSKDIFSERRLTLLIFWDSYCPDCLKTVAECQKFYQYTQEKELNIGVWSINFDNEKLSQARNFIKGEGITFPVLSDPRAVAVRRYQAEIYDFSFFIINNKGVIQYICYDHPPDVVEIIKDKTEKLLRERLKLSAPAPNFTLKTLDESEIISSEEMFPRNDLNLLLFWTSKCEESLDVINEYQKTYDTIQKLGIGFLSINFDDDPGRVSYIKKEKKLEFPVLYDADKSVAKIYKVKDCCFSIFIVDNKGIIKNSFYEVPVKTDAIVKEVEKLRLKEEGKQ